MITVTRVDSLCSIFYFLIGNRLNRTRTVVTFDRRDLIDVYNVEHYVQEHLAQAIWLSMPVHDH